MNPIVVRAGQTTQPIPLGVGASLTLTPGTVGTNSGYAEYTLSGAIAIQNNLATWATWPKGTVTAATSDTCAYPVFVRLTCTAGQMQGSFGDATASNATPLVPWQSLQAASPFDASGNYLGSSLAGVINGLGAQALLWANRPSATLYPGASFRFTDVGGNTGTGGGNFFFSNGTRYKAVNGSVTLDSVDTANAGVADTTEQQLNPNAILIPGGVIGGNDRLRIYLGISKSGAADTATIRLRMGPLKTTADPLLATITMATTNISLGTVLEFKRISATSLQKQGNGDTAGNYNGLSTTAYPAAVGSLSNFDTVGQYLSITQQMTGGTEFITLQDYTLELFSTDSA